MPVIDHLVYAAPDLDVGVAEIERLTGAAAVAGGPHVGMGTRNALVAFDDTTYLEIIGVDPDQPEPIGPRPFGLDDGAAPRLAAYAVRPWPGETIADIGAVFATHGFALSDAAPMSRRRPDGVELTWEIAFPATPESFADGVLPFVIDWGDTESPAVSAPVAGPLITLAAAHPDAAARDALAALDLGIEIDVGPAALVATVETVSGSVELR